MRILHLAYEDPAQPGSGGGSVRTYEINRRLASNHEIVAVVSGYPGAQRRREAGVEWIPLGTKGPQTLLNRLSYFGLLNTAVLRQEFDLVVEDFGAPFSAGFSPLFTRKPVIASVQWLFAAEMRQKYHLPFDWVERAGLPLYDNFIAVSGWLADDIQRRRPAAQVDVVHNGVETAAFEVTPRTPEYLLYVGRLDTAQKGCDLMLQAYAWAQSQLGHPLPPLRIIGDGADRDQLEGLAAQLAISESVHFLGRVDGVAKYEQMAGALAVLMPSRFETFGMVAVEAQAAGAPVIAFNVGPLAEVAGPGGAVLCTPFSIEEYASQIARLVRLPQHFARLRQQGRQWAQRYNWDTLAAQQELLYEKVMLGYAVTKNPPQNYDQLRKQSYNQ